MARPTKAEKQKEIQKQIDEAKPKYANWYDVVHKGAEPVLIKIKPIKK